MGLGEFIQNIDRAFGARPSVQERDSFEREVAFGVSQGFHEQFMTECRTGIERIRERNQFVFSRTLRNNVEEMCGTIGQVLQRCNEEPALISDARELPAILARIPATLDNYSRIYTVQTAATDPDLVVTHRTIGSMTKELKALHEDLLTGARISLGTLNATLSRIQSRQAAGQLAETQN